MSIFDAVLVFIVGDNKRGKVLEDIMNLTLEQLERELKELGMFGEWNKALVPMGVEGKVMAIRKIQKAIE